MTLNRAKRQSREHALDAELVRRRDVAEQAGGRLPRGVQILALEIRERDTILAALEEPPEDLAELRGVLLREFAWLGAEGLA
jgi:hypothetical protein